MWAVDAGATVTLALSSLTSQRYRRLLPCDSVVDSGADEHICHPRIHARPLIHHVRLVAVDDTVFSIADKLAGSSVG